METQKKQINIERCLKVIKDIYVQGNPEEREYLIETAISSIQTDGIKALKHSYLGIKNYASFGDQRCDCEYGFGPKHGSIVFSIGRIKPSADITLNADHIYFLECVRDFGMTKNIDDGEYDPEYINLNTLLRKREILISKIEVLNSMIEKATVESYVDSLN